MVQKPEFIRREQTSSPKLESNIRTHSLFYGKPWEEYCTQQSRQDVAYGFGLYWNLLRI